jgi:PAB-dependent poly(A)-specific ribonuclease subunit 2
MSAFGFQAIVCQIMTKAKHSHLVAIVKGKLDSSQSSPKLHLTTILVPEAEGQPNLKGPWFLFNDFVVRNITEEEALCFPSTWKVRAHSAFLLSHVLSRQNRSPLCYI